MEVRWASQESHNAAWVRDLVKKWIEDIGSFRFCAACSDSTGNTLSARSLLEKEYPFIISLADICHHLDNTAKDIVQIDYFSNAVRIVRGTIKTFTRSNLGRSSLASAREKLQTGPGLEKVGNTGFVTITLSSISVQRTLPAIKQVVVDGNFQFDFSNYFEDPQTDEGHAFQNELRHLILATISLAMALACLEGNDANPADVFIFWHAAIFTIEKALNNTKNRFPTHAKESILSILNHRHAQLFTEGGRLYSMVYVTAAYLNPAYLDSDLFVDGERNPLEPTPADIIEHLKQR
ncbi:hypothetical protein MPER_03338, partial [Moniliophthora perniciosa FA553]